MTIRPNNFGTVGTHPSQHTHIQPATTFTEMSLVTVGGGEGKILADSKDQFFTELHHHVYCNNALSQDRIILNRIILNLYEKGH